MISAFMLIPLVIAIALNEVSAVPAFMLGIGTCSIFAALFMLCRTKPTPLNWHQALIITGLCWVVLSIFGAIPLYFSDNYSSYLDAFFETVSCFTTTGLSVSIDQDHMAFSFIMWRCVMNVAGGIGVVVIALALGIFGSSSIAASLYQAEGRSGHVMPEIRQTSRFIFNVSLVVITLGTLACSIACYFSGMTVDHAIFNGIFLTLSDFSTGGMTAHSSGIVYYHSWPVELITMVIMVASCINFLLYGDLWKGTIKPFLQDIEVRTIIIWVSLLVILVVLALGASSYFNTLGSVIRRGLYEVMSAAFNTGYSTLYPGQVLYACGTGVLFVIVLGMCIGGCASSISGGIKALRVGIIFKAIVQYIRQAIAPDRARPRTFFNYHGRQLLTPSLISSAMTILLMYVVTYAIGAIAGVIYGYDALPAIFESVSATSNTGLSAGITSASMPWGLKVVYIIQMWLGRLEFIAFFAMLIELIVSVLPRRGATLRKERKKKKESKKVEKRGAKKKKGGENKEEHKRKKGGANKEERKEKKGGALGISSSVVGVLLAFVLVVACGVPQIAYATNNPASSGSSGGVSGDAESNIETLTNRYELLSNLGNANTDDSDVVVETRSDVLTRVNRALDGALVRIQGEAVGDKLISTNEGVWINVLGSTGSCIGVQMSKDLSQLIANMGDYNTSGTVIQITGDYHVACHEHQGELDIHAQKIEVLDVGGQIDHSFDLGQLILSVLLCIIALILFVLYIYLRFLKSPKDDGSAGADNGVDSTGGVVATNHGEHPNNSAVNNGEHQPRFRSATNGEHPHTILKGHT